MTVWTYKPDSARNSSLTTSRDTDTGEAISNTDGLF
jgi:hypothetical protein